MNLRFEEKENKKNNNEVKFTNLFDLIEDTIKLFDINRPQRLLY